jgi:hypothetical protein
MAEIECPQCKALNQDTARYCFECGAPLLAGVSSGSGASRQAPRLAAGKVLQDRYRIISELGRGGFGAVYRAWDQRLNKAVALKENLETKPEAQRQFSREALVLANLYHPNLPRVTDHFTIQGQGQYLVMDYVDGEDLARLLDRQKPIPPVKALEWILQVAGALEYLHSQQPAVLHRDIKPANIRLTPEGQAMLVDFGLVKVTGPQMETTMGARAVSPGYAPPEQYGRGVTDARADIYALAATLYILLTGKDPVESVRRLSGTVMPPAAEVNPAIPLPVSLAIERAMALDPESRYQHVSEFKAALQNGLEAARTAASQASPGPAVVQVVGAGVAAGKAASAAVSSAPAARPSAQPAPLKTQVVAGGMEVPPQTMVMSTEAAGTAYQAYPAAQQKQGGGGLRWVVLGGVGTLAVLLCLVVLAGALGFGGLQAANKTATARSAATLQARVAGTVTSQAQATDQVEAARGATEAAQKQETVVVATATALAQQARSSAATATALAGGDTTATARARSSATARAGASATAVVQATVDYLNGLNSWPATFYESFDNNDNDWYIHSGSTENWTDKSAQISDGVYRVRLQSNGKYKGWLAINDNAVTGNQFSITARTHVLTGKGAVYGLVFRYQKDGKGYYELDVSDKGSFALWVARDDKFTKLISKDFTSAIVPGEWNQVTVAGDGKKFQIYINGSLVGSTTNDWFTSGTAGLYYEVGTDNIGEFESDDFLINAP